MTLQMQLFSTLTKRITCALMVMVILWMAVSPTMLSAYAGLGGYISEKMLGSSIDSLYLSSGSGVMVLGTAPTVTTLSATGVSDTGGLATLNGNLSSLNGMPNANVWFEWGYSAGTMTNVTPTVNVGVAGVQSANLVGIDSSQAVYYRMVSSTDSTVYGNIVDFTTNRGLAFWLLLNLITLVMAAGILIVAMKVGMTGNWVSALILIIVGLIGIVLVRGLLGG